MKKSMARINGHDSDRFLLPDNPITRQNAARSAMDMILAAGESMKHTILEPLACLYDRHTVSNQIRARIKLSGKAKKVIESIFYTKI